MVWIVKKGISCLLILLGVTFVTFALMHLAGRDAISYRSRSGFVTHSSLCIRIMHQGICVERGAMEEILRHPKELYTRRLLEAAGVG